MVGNYSQNLETWYIEMGWLRGYGHVELCRALLNLWVVTPYDHRWHVEVMKILVAVKGF